jgi:hypothetical protein
MSAITAMKGGQLMKYPRRTVVDMNGYDLMGLNTRIYCG